MKWVSSQQEQNDFTSRDQMNEENELLYFKVDNVRSHDLFDWSNSYVRSDSSPKVARRKTHHSTGGGSRPRTGHVVKVNGEEIALFRFGDDILAVKEKCPHQGGPLHLGDIEVLPDRSLCVKCPWHHWCVDLANGNVRRPAGREMATKVYVTKVTSEGEVFVGFHQFSDQYFQCKDEF